MTCFKHSFSQAVGPLFLGTTLLAGSLAAPAFAKDQVHSCVANPGAQETATFVFHPRLFGVAGMEGDGDVFNDDFEHQFSYSIKVTEYDPARPDWTGPELCNHFSGWQISWDLPKIRYEFMEQNPGGIIYLKDVPRFSKIELGLWVEEMDSGSNDRLDFDPSPSTPGWLDLTVLVNEMKAQTMVGARNGDWDVDLNRAKRLVGDGKTSFPGDKVRGFLEFVVNLHVDEAKVDPNLLPKVDPLVPVTGTIITHEPLCRDYAKKAVEMNVEAQKIGCGFSGPVWSNDHESHFKWCMQGNNPAQAGPENIKRAAALNDCAVKKTAAVKPDQAVCAVYASEAVKISGQAAAIACGFSGPRWSSDYNAHLNWCTGGVDQAALVSETLARAAEYDACYKSKSKP